MPATATAAGRASPRLRCPIVWCSQRCVGEALYLREQPTIGCARAVRCCPRRPRGAALLRNQARRTRTPWSLQERLSGSSPSARSGPSLFQESFTLGHPGRKTTRRQPDGRPWSRPLVIVTAAHGSCLKWQPHNARRYVKSAAGTSSLGGVRYVPKNEFHYTG